MSDAVPAFICPPRAGQHCRHYSYDLSGPGASGPRCAVNALGLDPGAALCCMPQPKESCALRAEWTEVEREAWQAWLEASVIRLANAVGALPAPIPLRTSGLIACPNCGGKLHYSRWHRGAAVVCETEGCCEARFSIEAGADWPTRQTEPMP